MSQHTFTSILPGDAQNMQYWTRKLGADTRQISDAIIHLGTLDPVAIKEYLDRDSWLRHPVTKGKQMILATYRFIF